MPLPAQGDGRGFEGVASGTVTRGDILSGTPAALARNTTSLPIIGIALSGSADAINGKITYVVPGADQLFWCDVADASTLAAGDTVKFTWDTDHFIAAANGVDPAEATVVKGVADLTQIEDATPRVLVQILRSEQVFI